jgi:hypothetical protein
MPMSAKWQLEMWQTLAEILGGGVEVTDARSDATGRSGLAERPGPAAGQARSTSRLPDQAGRARVRPTSCG